MATKTRKSSARKKSARATRKRGAARKTSKKRRGAVGRAAKAAGAVKRRRPAKRTARQSPIARVKRVTQEVVQQATSAVTAGVETLKDLGGNLVDRVRQQNRIVNRES